MAGLSEDDLKALVANEMRQALGYSSSKLSNARIKAEYYYLGQPIGELAPPDIEGRSTYVSSRIRDTIESMMPQLMVTFCGGDSVVDFEATKPQDEAAAKQATEYINYLFFKKNNGHKITYNWIKDALLQKNGIIKVWWDTRNDEKKEEYRGLTEIEVTQVLDDDALELLSQKSYPDPQDIKHREEAVEYITKQLEQAKQAVGNAMAMQAAIGLQAQLDNIAQQPVPMLYDISCKRIPKGRVCIDNVPPEEFLIARDAKTIEDARYVGHRTKRTRSELKSMGYKNVDNLGIGDEMASNMERQMRISWNDERGDFNDIGSMDESQRTVWVTESYVRADYDGDGIAELRKVTMAGGEMLDNEEVDEIPFVSISPIPLQHTFYGLSIADVLFEVQRTETALIRATLDNQYLQTNGRYFAIEGQVNIDDLLTSRPGGVVRINREGAVGRLDQGHSDSQGSMALLEYMQYDAENRSGWSRQSMGNKANGLEMTATAANIVTNKADMRVDLIARNFSEGFTELFRLMLKLVSQYQQKEEIIKLTGGWAQINPTEWRNEFGVTINVGIGMGNKDQRMAHMRELIQLQQAGLQLGFSTPGNLYNSSTELSNLLGFKSVEKFFTDPAKQPPKPQEPPPEMIKARAQMAVERMKAEMQIQSDEANRQHEAQLEAMRAKMQAEVDNNRQLSEAQQKSIEVQQQAELEQMKATFAEQNSIRELAFNEWKAKLEAETKLAIAQLSSQTSLKQSAMSQKEGFTEFDEEGTERPSGALAQLVETMNQGLQQLVGTVQQQQAESQAMHAQVLQKISRPKMIQRGADGRVIGVT